MINRPLCDLEKYFGKSSQDSRVIRGFSVDSRCIEPGFVFFALPGNKVDGHTFLQEVFDKGAIAAVVSSDRASGSDLVLISVDDVLLSLHRLARDFVASQSSRIVAITGSVGKTTTKEFCASLLSSRYTVFKTPGNANSQIGLPLSLLNQSSLPEICILEMGMSGLGQIARLVGIAPPELAVITKIAPAHLEFFSEGLSGIAKAKSEICLHPLTKHAIINSQASVFDVIVNSGEYSTTFYSADPNARYPCTQYLCHQKDASVCILDAKEQSPWIVVPFTESHWIENFMAAALVARYFGISWKEIQEVAAHLPVIERRFERVEKSGIVFISDCYNANPVSMKAALSSLPRPAVGGRVVAVLGHMVELGEYSFLFHEDIGFFAADYVDHLFCLGEKCIPLKNAFAQSGKGACIFYDIDEMKKQVFAYLHAGDVVLIKASNSVGLWRLLESDEIDLCF